MKKRLSQIFIIIPILIIIVSINFMYGCTPAVMDKVQIQQLNMEMVPSFDPPIKVNKPENPIPIFLDGDFNKVDNIDNLEYFAFNKEEFLKIIQLDQSFDVLNQLSYFYIGFINEEIETNNDLRDLINRKDIISQHFADLYINEQNLRLQENYQNEKDKILDKIFLFIQSGVILALIL